jgi:hypothetical protein
LVRADAEALVHEYGDQAYDEARRRERDLILPDGTTHQGRTPRHWRRVALSVAKITGHAIGLDTATRMLTDTERASIHADKHLPVDEEMRRLLGE